MIDMVPKAIMLNLVAHSKEELQRELLTELYKTDVLDELLQESDYTQQRRKECKKMIEVSGGCAFTLMRCACWYTYTLLNIGSSKS
jgi:hypothetical protein